jgi:hypothetical protein
MKKTETQFPTDAKKLDPITVGSTVVEITIERFPGSILTTATSGDITEAHMHTLHPNHQQQPEELVKERQRILQKLATTVAGRVQSEALLDGVFSKLPPSK